jgi:hypothetical protein
VYQKDKTARTTPKLLNLWPYKTKLYQTSPHKEELGETVHLIVSFVAKEELQCVSQNPFRR